MQGGVRAGVLRAVVTGEGRRCCSAGWCAGRGARVKVEVEVEGWNALPAFNPGRGHTTDQLTPARDGHHRVPVAVADLDVRPASIEKELDDVQVTPRRGRCDRGDSVHIPLVDVGALPNAPTDHVEVALMVAVASGSVRMRVWG